MGWVRGYYRQSRPKSSAGAVGAVVLGFLIFLAWISSGSSRPPPGAPAMTRAPSFVPAPPSPAPTLPAAHHHHDHHPHAALPTETAPAPTGEHRCYNAASLVVMTSAASCTSAGLFDEPPSAHPTRQTCRDRDGQIVTLSEGQDCVRNGYANVAGSPHH